MVNVTCLLRPGYKLLAAGEIETAGRDAASNSAESGLCDRDVLAR